MTDHRMRIIQAIKQTTRFLNKERTYPYRLQDHNLVSFYEQHLETLHSMLTAKNEALPELAVHWTFDEIYQEISELLGIPLIECKERISTESIKQHLLDSIETLEGIAHASGLAQIAIIAESHLEQLS